MTRPNEKEWVIQEGEDTEEMPIGTFLPKAFKDAQEKYIDWIHSKHKDLEHQMKCNRCGDYFDMRNLSRIVVHEECERVKPFKQGERI